MDLLELRPEGIYCAAGEFYLDPVDPVERAIFTSAARARPGTRQCLTAPSGAPLLRHRIGPGAAIQPARYAERIAVGEVSVSLHPAGHMLGSAQVRLERRGEVWLFAPDCKPAANPSCEAFEPVRCHTLLTGAAFALPIFRWKAEADEAAAIHQWWRANLEAGKTSILYAAPLGQAPRVLALLDLSPGPIHLHEDVEQICSFYRAAGVPLPAGNSAPEAATLHIVPPGWGARGARLSTAMVSGWMRLRGTRRRRSLDRGFALSSLADWTQLLDAIAATGAECVRVTHGFRAPLARWLEEHGRRALVLEAPLAEAES